MKAKKKLFIKSYFVLYCCDIAFSTHVCCKNAEHNFVKLYNSVISISGKTYSRYEGRNHDALEAKVDLM